MARNGQWHACIEGKHSANAKSDAKLTCYSQDACGFEIKLLCCGRQSSISKLDGTAWLQAMPAAHKGFLNRAAEIPVECLYQHACSLNKRLVLTGVILVARSLRFCILV